MARIRLKPDATSRAGAASTAMDAVSAVLIERASQAPGLRRMAVWSASVHAVAVLGMVVVQGTLLGRTEPQPREVMTISLGGAPGPRAGGANPLGGRPVQREVTEAPARPEPVRAPAAKTPEMTIPAPSRKAAPREKFGEVKNAPEDARGRTPTTGPRERFGESAAETGGFGFGTGLSTGGGGTAGRLDVGNFCCPDYLETMMTRIQRNWESRQQVAGVVTIKFTILRNGTITSVELERGSGFPGLDLTAQRALLNTRQLPELPAGYPNPTLTVHLNFEYQR
jgi:protein TonB